MMSAKRDMPLIAEVRPAVDLVKLAHLWDLACGKEDRSEQAKAVAEKTLGEARLEKGRLLVEARKAFPARGPKAKGWGELLAKWKIDERTARRYMSLAGYVEDGISDNVSETRPVPTYAQAGITKPAKAESPAELLVVQRAPQPREASAPPSTETREGATSQMMRFAAEARASICKLAESNVHLADFTSSPGDFMRAKQLLIDIVTLCLDELANAGVLDGKERRRQLQLLEVAGSA